MLLAPVFWQKRSRDATSVGVGHALSVPHAVLSAVPCGYFPCSGGGLIRRNQRRVSTSLSVKKLACRCRPANVTPIMLLLSEVKEMGNSSNLKFNTVEREMG